jgi:hypothetical protein
MRSVIEREVLVLQFHGSTDTFGLKAEDQPKHCISKIHATHYTVSILVDFSSQLKVNSSENSSLLLVDSHRRRDLLDDVDEMSSLQRRVGLGRFCATMRGRYQYDPNDIAIRVVESAYFPCCGTFRLFFNQLKWNDQSNHLSLTIASHCQTTICRVALTASIWAGKNFSILSAPYLLIKVTLPGMLSGLTTV